MADLKTYRYYAGGQRHDPASGKWIESENPATGEVWARDVNRAIRMADRIEAGTVYINNYLNAATQSPVGGFKQSGYGRENGWEGMRCFLQTKSVWLATRPHQPDPFG
jgi:acyl-CoA reductase-like NAD-dependent aldehyde dehydrogenase